MNRDLARAVLARLRPSRESSTATDLRRFGVRDWQQTMDWLVDSDLALYFLHHLQTSNETEIIPAQILRHLENCFEDNQLRWERLAEIFGRITQGFQQEGMPFAAIKGLSLVPDYCPNALLRTPSDLDFLIEKKDLHLAQRVLEMAGYHPKVTSGIDLKFWRPSAKIPTISDNPYSVNTEPLVELHLAFWENEHQIPLAEPFSLEHVVSHSWRNLSFPVLDETHAFLLQIVHVFLHIAKCWVKLCWLLEIGSFMSKRSHDEDLWRKINEQMLQFPGLIEFAGVVVSLVKIVFESPTPKITETWLHSLRPSSRLWLEKYAETWAVDEHPFRRSGFFRPAKLALFLHQQYVPDQHLRKQVIHQRLFPWKRPDQQVSFPGDYQPARSLRSQWLRGTFVMNRIKYHAGSTLRYLGEAPLWRYRMNRATRRSPSV